MKKGFTLIELLAVIVILAIIALIATPIILGIIEDARKGSIEASANGYIDALEYSSARNELKGEKLSDGTYDVTKLEVDLDGEKPTSGIVTIEKGKVINATLIINNQTVYYNGNTPKVVDDKTDNYKESILNGADPVLKDELVPVIIANDGTVIKANEKTNWYSYEDKRWANAVILFNKDNYKVGEIIPEETIKEYYVWIPKYSYRLWNVNGDTAEGSEKPIEIVFGDEAKTTGENNGDMYIHPAFTNFNTQGIWVGKFEISYNEETFTDSSTFFKVNPNVEVATNSSELIIKPNVRGLTYKDVSEFYTMLYNSHRNLDSHMMTNMEWGAAAYLTYSIYGRCDSDKCIGVVGNDITTHHTEYEKDFEGQWEYGNSITGCAGTEGEITRVPTKSDKCINAYNSTNGFKASTTGNITGIYDMAGGNWECVMGVLVDSNGDIFTGYSSNLTSKFKGKYGIDGSLKNDGIEKPKSKYYNSYNNKYGYNSNAYNDYSEGLLGDATKEITIPNGIRIWFTGNRTFVSMQGPWFIRGGDFKLLSYGIFSFYSNNGIESSNGTTRAVLAF